MTTQAKISERITDVVARHSNDFGFNPRDIAGWSPPALPDLSVIIPYYETGPLFRSVLVHLYRSISIVVGEYPRWRYEIIVLDDGSVRSPLRHQITENEWPNLKIASSPSNTGRTLTRNQGLVMSQYRQCLFMDSDIAPDMTAIRHSLVLAVRCVEITGKPAIVPSLFETRPTLPPAEKRISSDEICINDFRVSCRYQRSWIGCKNDEFFVSRDFALIDETDCFRSWAGSVGPWILPNMVLGGFFLVDRRDALSVNGFDAMFREYGFTETTLPTKLIAHLGHFLVPQVVGGAIHASGNPSHLSQGERDALFREAHHKFYNGFLNLTISEAVERSLITWSDDFYA